MSIVSKEELINLLYPTDSKPRLIITPLLDPDEQLQDGSVDVRLSNEFIIIKRTEVIALDPIKSLEIAEEIEQYQTKIHIPYGSNFVLHPQEFALAGTLEYLSLPLDLMAYVSGRSSWGRLGLVIATATSVKPGFKGIITLELANLGSVPIVLYPCIRIAQLTFHKIKE